MQRSLPAHAMQKPSDFGKREPLAEAARKPGRRYSRQELDLLVRKRDELIGQGLCDKNISGELSAIMDRSAFSIYGKILELRKGGAIQQNPYGRIPLQGHEIRLIKSLRPGLIEKGLSDNQIAGILAERLGRPHDKIKNWIYHALDMKKLEANPNGSKTYSGQENETIISNRERMMAEGKSDGEIAEALAPLLSRTRGCIRQKIRVLVQGGTVRPNPNNQRARRYTDEGLRFLIRRREELMAQGKADDEISVLLAKEMGRSENAMRLKLTKMKNKGEIERNKNDRKVRPPGFLSDMTDLALALYAQRIVTENGFTCKKELEGADGHLVAVLRKRKLIDAIGFKDGISDADDETLLKEAERLMEENGLRSKTALKGKAWRLVRELESRKTKDGKPLLSRLEFDKAQRDWSKIPDGEIIEKGRSAIRANGIKNKQALKRHDGGLHSVLLRRKLIDLAFEDVYADMERDAVEQVVQGLRSL